VLSVQIIGPMWPPTDFKRKVYGTASILQLTKQPEQVKDISAFNSKVNMGALRACNPELTAQIEHTREIWRLVFDVSEELAACRIRVF
jgi:hypothetical protein